MDLFIYSIDMIKHLKMKIPKRKEDRREGGNRDTRDRVHVYGEVEELCQKENIVIEQDLVLQPKEKYFIVTI